MLGMLTNFSCFSLDFWVFCLEHMSQHFNCNITIFFPFLTPHSYWTLTSLSFFAQNYRTIVSYRWTTGVCVCVCLSAQRNAKTWTMNMFPCIHRIHGKKGGNLWCLKNCHCMSLSSDIGPRASVLKIKLNYCGFVPLVRDKKENHRRR